MKGRYEDEKEGGEAEDETGEDKEEDKEESNENDGDNNDMKTTTRRMLYRSWCCFVIGVTER